MENELVSIICTVKNGERTIKDTLDSIINQTYQHWEMVIVDDGSDDNTLNILKNYANEDKRIKPHFTKGIGRGEALNKAVALTQGNYITNLDADDLIHPQKIDAQIKIMNQDSSIFLVGTGTIIFHNDNKPLWEEININHNDYHVIDRKILVENIINHSSVMMNKSMLVAIGMYNTSRKTQYDYELWLRAYSANLKMVVLNEKLSATRVHLYQSFENKKRFQYLVSNALLQMKYNLQLKKNLHLLFILPLSIPVGLLPFKYRRIIRRMLKDT